MQKKRKSGHNHTVTDFGVLSAEKRSLKKQMNLGERLERKTREVEACIGSVCSSQRKFTVFCTS